MLAVLYVRAAPGASAWLVVGRAGVCILPRQKPSIQIYKRDASEGGPRLYIRIGIVDRHGRDHRLKQVNEPDSQIMRVQANHIRYFELNASAA